MDISDSTIVEVSAMIDVGGCILPIFINIYQMDIDINNFYYNYFLLHYFITLKNWQHRKRQNLFTIIFANFVVQKISLQWSFITNFVCTHRSSSLNIHVIQKLVDIYSITVVFFCNQNCNLVFYSLTTMQNEKYDLKDFPKKKQLFLCLYYWRNLEIVFSVLQNQCNIVVIVYVIPVIHYLKELYIYKRIIYIYIITYINIQ